MYADFIAGWMAGGVSLVVGHPLDTVKTRLQTMNAYTGFNDCIAKTIRNESMFGLYKGMFLPFITSGVLHSLLFASYAATLRIINRDRQQNEKQEKLPLKEILFATMVGAIVQLVPGVPIELVKTKLQVQRERRSFKASVVSTSLAKQPNFHRTADVVRSVYRESGILGLYKGGSAMLLRDVIGLGCYLPTYEATKYYLRRKGCSETTAEIFAGGTAGSLSWFSICPFEVMKNVSQTQSKFSQGRLLAAATKIFKKEGIPGFYKGGLTLITRGFVVNAVLFVVYEKTFAFFDR